NMKNVKGIREYAKELLNSVHMDEKMTDADIKRLDTVATLADFLMNVADELEKERKINDEILKITGGITAELKKQIDDIADSHRLRLLEIKGYDAIYNKRQKLKLLEERINQRIEDAIDREKKRIGLGGKTAEEARQHLKWLRDLQEIKKQITDEDIESIINGEKLTDNAKKTLELMEKSPVIQKEITDWLKLHTDIKEDTFQIQQDINDLVEEYNYYINRNRVGLSDAEKLVKDIAFATRNVNTEIVKQKIALEKIIDYNKKYFDEINQIAESLSDKFAKAFVNATRETKNWADYFLKTIQNIGDTLYQELAKTFARRYAGTLFETLGRAELTTRGKELVPITTAIATATAGIAGIKDLKEKSEESAKVFSDTFIRGLRQRKMINTLSFVLASAAAPLIRLFGGRVTPETVTAAQSFATFGQLLGNIIVKSVPGAPLIGTILGGIFGYTFGRRHHKKQDEMIEELTNVNANLQFADIQLEFVNRNLIGLRQDLQPYIMPRSYYFRQRPEININIMPGSASPEEIARATANILNEQMRANF
ncbi:MAG: hypothetical protein ACTSO4_15990, partial [Promethearchaeota archaeon]